LGAAAALTRSTRTEPDGLAAVIRDGTPQLLEQVSDDMLVAGARDDEHLAVLRAVGLTSTMIVPVTAGARTLGALSFVSSTSRRFDQRDLQAGVRPGSPGGDPINNARLHAEQAHIARTLQAGLLPGELPALPGWQAQVVYPAAGDANEAGATSMTSSGSPGGGRRSSAMSSARAPKRRC
jgi:hypothetical protein